ncbi:MAG: hypothetical protein AMXMBFR53_26260 [Gemmatimonadota bacterium]
MSESSPPESPFPAEWETDRAFGRRGEDGDLRVIEARAPGSYPPSPVRAPGGTARALLAEERERG